MDLLPRGGRSSGISISAIAPFFRAAGLRARETGALANVGTNGYYWSSSSYCAGNINAGNLNFGSGNVYPLNWNNRANAFSVRCVQHLQARLSLRLFDTLVSILFSEIR